MCQYQLKLNLAKCAFDIDSTKFWDLIVSNREIEATVEHIKVIIEIEATKI